MLAGHLGSGRVLIVSRGPEHMQTRDRRPGFLDRIAAHHRGIRAAELVLSESHAPHDQIREALASPGWAGVFATSADSQVVGEMLRDRGGTTSFSLQGEVALVTGGAGHYRRQIVLALADAGALVFVASRNLDALQALADEQRWRGRDVEALRLDQGDQA